ncbi:MAG: energy-coupling factor transporter ATPase [Erysipelothrix sp.]|jgi:energy-coupling factor transport system ATP-binding protein|nr:energy-coupling factor transporter ATPase [Erysipelothrix sp.]
MSITFKNVSFEYSPDTPFAYDALRNVNVHIKKERITAIIGATGSGKSTLVQHLNALLLPSAGEVHVLDRVIKATEKPKNLKSLRQQVGLVFQFPEYQLFEETILKDVAFGPLNFGDTKEVAYQKAKVALEIVGLTQDMHEKSPLDMSGGQKRRAAIAGILAINPEILVLDEPTAGLDPQGAKAMMELFSKLNETQKTTICLVTHDMEHVFEYCDDVVVLNEGEVIYTNTVENFFNDEAFLSQLVIEIPKVIQLKQLLKKKGYDLDVHNYDLKHIVEQVMKQRGASHE